LNCSQGKGNELRVPTDWLKLGGVTRFVNPNLDQNQPLDTFPFQRGRVFWFDVTAQFACPRPVSHPDHVLTLCLEGLPIPAKPDHDPSG